jgi:fucose permease
LDTTLNTARTGKSYSKISLVLLAYVAFIALGMRDGLLGVAWPSIRGDFIKPIDAIGILLVAGVAGYMTSSFLIGSLIRRMGIGNLMVVSCTLAGATLVAFSFATSWWMLVGLSVIGGLGAGGIDAGLNTFVAAHFGEGPMQWLHASYGLGITFGPIIMTICLTRLNSWRLGYRSVSGFSIALLACIILTLPRWRQHDQGEESNLTKRLTDYKTPMVTSLGQPRVWLSALLFFLYVGAEMALGTWTYSLLVESRGVDPSLAGIWTGSYWATFTVGRVLAGLYAGRLGANRLVQAGLIGALLGALLLAWNPSVTANLVAVGLIGFCIAPIFPALMSGTSQRVGIQFAANTIGLQMAATGLGTAVIPGLFGVLARQYSLEVIPTLLVIVFLGLLGSYFISTKTRPQEISL